MRPSQHAARQELRVPWFDGPDRLWNARCEILIGLLRAASSALTTLGGLRRRPPCRATSVSDRARWRLRQDIACQPQAGGGTNRGFDCSRMCTSVFPVIATLALLAVRSFYYFADGCFLAGTSCRTGPPARHTCNGQECPSHFGCGHRLRHLIRSPGTSSLGLQVVESKANLEGTRSRPNFGRCPGSRRNRKANRRPG